MSQDQSGAAFPSNREGEFNSSGLSKREYFAGLAMQAIGTDSTASVPMEECARLAVKMADALLKELAK